MEQTNILVKYVYFVPDLGILRGGPIGHGRKKLDKYIHIGVFFRVYFLLMPSVPEIGSGSTMNKTVTEDWVHAYTRN